MKKIISRLKVVSIDVFIYGLLDYNLLEPKHKEYRIDKEIVKKGKTRYFIKDNGLVIHESFLYSKIYLLKSIKKQGPVIGDCKTIKSHRGQSIYPYVINHIARDVFDNNINNEVFMVVDTTNVNSIKGIEKAGFHRVASIKAKRWLWFYLKRKTTYFNKKAN
jgi:hypothetical protein